MCNATGIAFGQRVLTADIVVGRDILEVGAYDVNGSVRPHVESLGPRSYVGVDISAGPRVDRVLDARNLVAELGRESADVVITTEMVEHVRDWPTVVSNLKGVLRPGGHLVLTTRSAGFAYHGWPHDFWRYEVDDMRRIFGDLEILALEPDPDPKSPGVFVFARRPDTYVERTPPLALLSIITLRRQRRVTDAEIAWFKAMTIVRRLLAAVRAGWRKAHRAARRRIVRPVWAALPVPVRRRIKATLGRTG